MELEQGVKADQELKDLELYLNQEETKQTQEQEKLNPTASLGSEFDFFINFLHQLIINKILKLNFDIEIIKELDLNLKKIIEKRLPNLSNNLDKFGPEMAYIGTFATGFMLSQQNIDLNQLEQENKQLIENDKQENNNQNGSSGIEGK